jgi:hypothetical protein
MGSYSIDSLAEIKVTSITDNPSLINLYFISPPLEKGKGRGGV